MKLFLFILLLILASCRIERKIYASLPVNNPSLQVRNDFSVNATVSAPLAFDINGGYALTRNLALIAGGYTHRNKDIEVNSGFTNNYDSSNLVYRHNGFTLGAGFYFSLNPPKSSSILSFYAGINKGNFRMNEQFFQIRPTGPVRLNSYKSNLDRYFIQGSMNFYGHSFEGSVTTRFNLVEYKNVITDYTNDELSDYILPPFVAKRVNSFFDLAYDFKIYFSQQPSWGLQIFSVITTSTNHNDPGFNNIFHYYPFRGGTGIFFRGPSRKKGKK